jgi:phosphoribosyl-ATP pyrophosphohydrolase
MNLIELYAIIQDRKKKMPDSSYVTSLFKLGKDRIIQKVGEESTEVIIAAKGKSRKRIISEVADLLFHVLVLLSYLNIPIEDIYQELQKRHKKS